ncbi:CUE domain-containing protein [Cephalotus follicularis]|uniref:CUE domain-containing protein n=1 Tax=Cephalotus follicularis TaxID=3775 RepID=A0A1Q3D680_CEPFO|nr:CUE domain-containing protein [Cephalotus follicularis]
MSAIVCGKRSASVFEELAATTSPVTVVSKRIRCSSSSSPLRFSPFPSSPSPSSFIDQLVALFPHMDQRVLERVVEECGDDLDSAIRSLNDLRLESMASAASKSDVEPQGTVTTNAEVLSAEDPLAPKVLSMDGSEWVELFVREMMSASNIDDARVRASRALEVLEKSIHARASAEAAQSFNQENMMLKEQVEALIQENAILKRAVSIQHERQKEYEDRSHELQHLKQLVSQYQDQLRTLEVNNYALTMHLKQAQQSSSIPGRFHPDIF